MGWECEEPSREFSGEQLARALQRRDGMPAPDEAERLDTYAEINRPRVED